jgi:hypothetical protein
MTGHVSCRAGQSFGQEQVLRPSFASGCAPSVQVSVTTSSPRRPTILPSTVSSTDEAVAAHEQALESLDDAVRKRRQLAAILGAMENLSVAEACAANFFGLT